MTARITDRLHDWWLALDNAAYYTRLRLRIVTGRADADDVVQWAAGEFRRLDAEDLERLLVHEWAKQRRAKADAERFVRSLGLPYELSDELTRDLLSLRDAMRRQAGDEKLVAAKRDQARLDLDALTGLVAGYNVVREAERILRDAD